MPRFTSVNGSIFGIIGLSAKVSTGEAVEYLVVGGGGGGAQGDNGSPGGGGGGGGGGGVLYGTLPTLDSGDSLSITIGGGGGQYTSGANTSVTGTKLTCTAVGGGGAGNAASVGLNGGSGGGGGGNSPGAETGKIGGSGVVIFRIITSLYSPNTTGSPTVTTSGVYTYYKFTQSGTITF